MNPGIQETSKDSNSVDKVYTIKTALMMYKTKKLMTAYGTTESSSRKWPVEHKANLGKQALLLAHSQTCWILIFNPCGAYFSKTCHLSPTISKGKQN